MKVVAGESAPDLNSSFNNVLFVPHNKLWKLSFCTAQSLVKEFKKSKLFKLVIYFPDKKSRSHETHNCEWGKKCCFSLSRSYSVFFTSTFRSSGNGRSPPSSLLIFCHFSPQPLTPSSNYKQTDPVRRTGETFDSLHKIKDEAARIVFSLKRMFPPKKTFQQRFKHELVNFSPFSKKSALFLAFTRSYPTHFCAAEAAKSVSCF